MLQGSIAKWPFFKSGALDMAFKKNVRSLSSLNKYLNRKFYIMCSIVAQRSVLCWSCPHGAKTTVGEGTWSLQHYFLYIIGPVVCLWG